MSQGRSHPEGFGTPRCDRRPALVQRPRGAGNLLGSGTLGGQVLLAAGFRGVSCLSVGRLGDQRVEGLNFSRRVRVAEE